MTAPPLQMEADGQPGPDQSRCANFTQTFSTKNVGSALTLTPSGTVSDGNAGNNYQVTFTRANSGQIDPATLTVTAVANTKQYDATVAAAAAPTVVGLQSGDTITGLIETYNNKNAGMGKTLTPAGTVNDGNGCHNYTASFFPITSGVITPAPLTITAVTNSKTYDATVNAAATPVVAGLQGSTDNLTGLSETYDTPIAGIGKTLAAAGYTVVDGNNGGNYTVTLVADHTGVILQALTTVSGTAPGTSVYGQAVTVSVTVAPQFGGAPTGAVTFSFIQNSTTYYLCADGSVQTAVCTVPVTVSSTGAYMASVTSNHLPTAANGITAMYSGDTNFLGETAQPVTVTVTQPIRRPA